MKARLTILLLSLVSAAGAQKLSQPKLIIGARPYTIISEDAAGKEFLRGMYLKSLRPNVETGHKDNMPNGFTGQLPMPRYKGNYGNGFNVYESTVDNMPMLVPDSTNRDNGMKSPKFEIFFEKPGKN